MKLNWGTIAGVSTGVLIAGFTILYLVGPITSWIISTHSGVPLIVGVSVSIFLILAGLKILVSSLNLKGDSGEEK